MIALPIELITPRVRTSLMNMVGRLTRSTWVADDIIAEALLKAMGKAWQINPKTFVSWIFTIARNLATDFWRRQEKHRRFMSRTNVKNFDGSPVIGLLQTEAVAEFKKMTRKLTKLQRQFIRLRVEKGLTYKEIASKTGQSEIAVRAMAHQVRLRLAPWRERMIGS